jgi:DNA-binding beta-propeller fold protein YncE
MRRRQIGVIGFLAVLLLFHCSPAYASPEFSYTVDKMRGNRIPIPLTYTIDQVIIDVDEKGFNKASDLFIDRQGNVYVADTGNNRIVKLSVGGQLLGAFGEGQGLEFNQPEGIFVDELGHMFVADTGNGRIVHLSPEGEFVEEFVKPESSLLKPDTPFNPNKVIIDRRGYMYVLDRNDYNGFMMIDAMNRFRGYIAANRVPFSWKKLVVRLLATPEQKEQLSKAVPPQHSNLTMDEKGYIYSPTVLIDKGQIKKFSATGVNIFKANTFYGENSVESGALETPYFVDLAVDQYGIINALDATSRKIYQYDQEGNLLAVFGGHGEVKGNFEYPSSIVVDTQGRIYVLDRDRNNIQVFEPTRFAELIHEASQLYFNGRYEEALKPWREVLKIDENYPLAHRGVAKALMKEEKWSEAMKEFKLAEDQEGYSLAFTEYRHELIREYFGWVLLGIVIFAYLVYLAVRKLRNAAHTIVGRLGF